MKKNNGFLPALIRLALTLFFLPAFFLFGLFHDNTHARDVSFTWTPNTETVDGYRIYYKTGSSGVPYDGTGAAEGPSPVATGNIASFTLHDLSDTETYYFALTAYLGPEESDYSTEITLPPSTGPAPGRNVSFVWSANPETVDGYRLYYEDIAVGDSCPLPADVTYNSQDAAEGASPVDTGDVTTFTLQDLALDKTYCFALTAYLGAEESGYTSPLQLTGNNPPVASQAFVTTGENNPVSGMLPANDPDGDALTYSIVTDGTMGSAAITNAATGAYTYTPNPDVAGSDSFTFKVNDGKQDSNTATVAVTITSVNDPPVALGSTVSTPEDTAAVGQLSATDPDGDQLTYTIIAGGTIGSAVITNPAAGTFTYTPNADANGSDSFTFKVNDGTQDSNIASVAVTVTPVNDAPSASDSALATEEDTAAGGQLSASDKDGDSLTYSIVSNGASGTASITNPATGAYTYTPDQDATGSDTFTFRVNDGTVNSNTATVSVTINPVNDPPIATASSLATDEDTPASGQLSGSDPDGDPLTYTIVSNGTLGTATITGPATGAFTYTPNADVSGSDTFTFRVNDGTVDSAPAAVSVTIAPVNDPPTASGSSLTTDEDTAADGQLSASDPEGDALTFSIVTNGTLGTASITNPATGAYTYTPDQDTTGSDAFTFKVHDGTVDSAPATVTVTIGAVNDAPTATPALLTVDEDTVGSGQLAGEDPDGDTLTYSIVADVSMGTVSLVDASTGEYTYTPDPDVFGSDTFTFRVSDGTVDSAPAAVNVTITAVNDPPVAAGEQISTDMNTVYSGRLYAADIDGDALTYTIIANGALGDAVVTDGATGAFTYTPNPDASGSDTFTFTVNDGTVDSPETAVDVTVFNELTITRVFGDTLGSDYPATLADTFADLNTDMNGAAETMSLSSFAPTPPYKVANTIIMKADLAAIPSYATVMEAKIYLYQTAATGEVIYDTTIHRIIGKDPIISQVTGYNAFNGEPWTPVPDGTTFNNIPLGLADIDVQEDSTPLFLQEGYRAWMITDMVQEWVRDPAVNLGMLLQGVEAATETGRLFASSENKNKAIRPKLVIRYRLIPPPPSMIMIEEIK